MKPSADSFNSFLTVSTDWFVEKPNLSREKGKVGRLVGSGMHAGAASSSKHEEVASYLEPCRMFSSASLSKCTTFPPYPLFSNQSPPNPCSRASRSLGWSRDFLPGEKRGWNRWDGLVVELEGVEARWTDGGGDGWKMDKGGGGRMDMAGSNGVGSYAFGIPSRPHAQ